MATGYDRLLIYKAESTWGTAVTPTRPVPFKSDGDGLAAAIERIDSDSFYAGSLVQSSNQWATGNNRVAGNITMELFDRAIVAWFQHALGSVSSTTASSPYTHTITPGVLTNLGLTVQIGRPGTSGTVQPFTYAGVKINRWTVHAEVGQAAHVVWECVAKSQTTATGLVTVTSGSYTSGIKTMTYIGGSVTIAGATNGVNVQSFDLTGDNKLAVDRAFIDGGATISEPLEGGMAFRDYGGTLNLEFYDLTQYNVFANASEVAVVLSLARGTSSLVATCNARFDGATPVLSSSWPQIVAVPFKCLRSGTGDASGISLAFTSPDSTP